MKTVIDLRCRVILSAAKDLSINRLVYYEHYSYVWDAIAREKKIKGWTRAKKNGLVARMNPGWNDLATALFDVEGSLRGPSLRSG